MKETLSKKETPFIVGAGIIIGIIAVALVYFGNPANMGFCIACFLRDTTGALGFHSAAAVQYIRPEIVGLVLGSCILALATKGTAQNKRKIKRRTEYRSSRFFLCPYSKNTAQNCYDYIIS